MLAVATSLGIPSQATLLRTRKELRGEVRWPPSCHRRERSLDNEQTRLGPVPAQLGSVDGMIASDQPRSSQSESGWGPKAAFAGSATPMRSIRMLRGPLREPLGRSHGRLAMTRERLPRGAGVALAWRLVGFGVAPGSPFRILGRRPARQSTRCIGVVSRHRRQIRVGRPAPSSDAAPEPTAAELRFATPPARSKSLDLPRAFGGCLVRRFGVSSSTRDGFVGSTGCSSAW